MNIKITFTAINKLILLINDNFKGLSHGVFYIYNFVILPVCNEP